MAVVDLGHAADMLPATTAGVLLLLVLSLSASI